MILPNDEGGDPDQRQHWQSCQGELSSSASHEPEDLSKQSEERKEKRK